MAKRGGPAPYGWRWERTGRTATGRQLVRDEHEQHVRWLILHMHRTGHSLPRIAGELHALHLGTRDGGETWPKTTLHRVITTAEQLDQTSIEPLDRRQFDRRATG